MRRGQPTWVVPAAVLLAGVVLTVVHLGEPATLVFDEIYYVADARAMLEDGVEGGFAVHPPLGKWLLAAGIAVVGDHPVGWRIAGALAGAVTALLVTVIVRRLTGREALAGLAGLLVLLDGVFLVQARTAMLDIHLAVFVVLGMWLLLVDRDRDDASGPRWWLAGAGAAFGAALAVKWSAALALAGAGVLFLLWEQARRHHLDGRRVRSLWGALAPGVAGLVAVPLLVYAAAWTPWLAKFERTHTAADLVEAEGQQAAAGASAAVRGLIEHHRDVLRFHLELQADHPYRAPATTWPLQQRPVVFYYEACGSDGLDSDGERCLGPTDRTSEIVALGSLALWWGGLPLLPVLVGAAFRRDRRAGLPLVMLAAQYLPWLLVARPVFSFYAVPMVPFLAIGVVVACDHLDRPARRIGLLAGSLAGAGLAAVAALVTAAITAIGAAPARVVLAAAAGALIGAAAGTWSDLRVERAGAAPHEARRVGTWLLAILAVVAAGLAVYFAPVWYGIPLPDESIRHRWWFDSWV